MPRKRSTHVKKETPPTALLPRGRQVGALAEPIAAPHPSLLRLVRILAIQAVQSELAAHRAAQQDPGEG